MMMDSERRQMKRFVRALGTDLTAFMSPEKQQEETGYEPVRAFPLAAIINPEVYGRLARQEFDTEDNAIPEDDYERQVAAIEQGGVLTDIDILSAKMDEKVKEAKGKTKLTRDSIPIWDPASGKPPPGTEEATAPPPTKRPSSPGRRVRMRRGKS
jgi:hypothetical protein